MAGPHVHTDLPADERGHRGERRLAQTLVALGDARTHLWFGVAYLPAVSDIDKLLVHEEIGCFNIEVKAVSPLAMIEQFGLDTCRIKGRGSSHHPVARASLAQLGLRNWCWPTGPRHDGPPGSRLP